MVEIDEWVVMSALCMLTSNQQLSAIITGNLIVTVRRRLSVAMAMLSSCSSAL